MVRLFTGFGQRQRRITVTNARVRIVLSMQAPKKGLLDDEMQRLETPAQVPSRKSSIMIHIASTYGADEGING